MMPMRIVAAAAVAALVIATTIGVARATAPFDHAVPGPGQVVASAPARVELFTRTPTSPAPGDTQVIVTGPEGSQADRNDSTVDPADHRHVIVDLKPGLPPGRYVVSFKTRGETDLEHDGGAYAFYAGTQPTAADLRADKALSLTAPNDLEGVPTLKGLSRGLVEGGLTVLIAGPAAVYYYMRRRARRAERVGSGQTRHPGPQ
jgi:methionine-rich copper-binding protein CopC